MSRIQIGIVTRNRVLQESLARFLVRKLPAEIYPADHLVSTKTASVIRPPSRILLIDAQTADSSTLGFVLEVLRGGHGCQVILFGLFPDRKWFVEALLWGVTGFVLYDAGAWSMLETVRMVSQGQLVCPAELCRLLFQPAGASPDLCENAAPLLVATAR